MASRCICGCRRNEHGDRAQGYACGNACRCERYRPKPLKRKTPLKRSTKPIPARKKDPSKRRFAKRRNPDFVAWAKERGCFLALHPMHRYCQFYDDRLQYEFMHIKTRGSGGDDAGNGIVGCPGIHDEQEGRTKAFEAKYQVNLREIAAALWAQYESTTKGVTP